MRKVSVVIPTLNEEEGIGKTLEEIPREELKRLGYDVEVIVVDGGSTDRTVEVAKEKGARVIVARRGYGKQYKAGFQVATGEIIATGDADASYPFSELPRLLKVLEEERLDFLTTNRLAKLEKGAMSPINYVGNRILSFLCRLLYGIDVQDSQSGMWVFRKRILGDLELVADGMPFSQEIKIEAFRKWKSKEVPISYRSRLGKKKLRTFRDGFVVLAFLFYKRLKLRSRRFASIAL